MALQAGHRVYSSIGTLLRLPRVLQGKVVVSSGDGSVRCEINCGLCRGPSYTKCLSGTFHVGLGEALACPVDGFPGRHALLLAALAVVGGDFRCFPTDCTGHTLVDFRPTPASTTRSGWYSHHVWGTRRRLALRTTRLRATWRPWCLGFFHPGVPSSAQPPARTHRTTARTHGLSVR